MTEVALNEWQEAQSEVGGITIQQLDAMGRAYSEKYSEYESAKQKSNALKAEADDLEAKMVEAMTQAGKTKYHVEGIGTFYFSNKMSVQTPKTIEDKKKFFKYILDTHGEVYYWDKVSVNSQTLQGIYNSDAAAAAERGEALFHIPGLDQPKNKTTLNLKGEKK